MYKIVYNIKDIPLPKNKEEAGQIYEFLSRLQNFANNYTGQPVQICWNDDAGFQSSSYLCHSYYMRGVTKYTTYVYNAFTTQTNKNTTTFLKWLLSEDSPYSELWTKYGHLFTVYIEKDTKRPLCISCTEFDKVPLKLFSNFLICSRLGYAWALGHLWQFLIDNGFTPTEALGIIPFFAFHGQEITTNASRNGRHTDEFRKHYKLTYQHPANTDMPFTYGSKEHFHFPILRDKAYNKEFALETLSMNPEVSPNPCNSMWSTTIPDESSYHYGGIFAKGDKNYSVYTTDNYGRFRIKKDQYKALFYIEENFNEDKPLDKTFVSNLKERMNKGAVVLPSEDLLNAT